MQSSALQTLFVVLRVESPLRIHEPEISLQGRSSVLWYSKFGGGGRRILRPLALREKISRVKTITGRKYLAEKMSSDTSTQSIRDDDHLPSE